MYKFKLGMKVTTFHCHLTSHVLAIHSAATVYWAPIISTCSQEYSPSPQGIQSLGHCTAALKTSGY